jgi:hypothetical protein
MLDHFLVLVMVATVPLRLLVAASGNERCKERGEEEEGSGEAHDGCWKVRSRGSRRR